MNYSEKVLDHFRNPRNMGKIDNPDGIGIAGNTRCGDLMHLYIKVENEKITDISFETFGCAAAISTSSMITEIAKGKTLDQAVQIKKDEIVEGLDDLPPIKVHCSILATDALAEAIYNYLEKNQKPISQDLEKRHQRIKKEREIVQEKYGD